MNSTTTGRPAAFPARVAVALIALAIAAGAGGCGRQAPDQESADMAAFQDVSDSAWAQLAGRRIYFGHQSVGGNIMEGVAELAAREPRLGLRVVEGLPADSAGVFAHGLVGRNGDPALKTDEFVRNVDGPAAGADIAFHKYCYADVFDTTDAARVFAHYRDAMAALRARHPGVTFVHVTAPLVVVQSGPRAQLKKLLGQAPGRYESNFRREEFNELLRKEYAGREPLFDLAALESTRPDGTRETIALKGRTAYSLHPGYSDDGSHLNAAGRRRVAEALLVLLAGLPAKP